MRDIGNGLAGSTPTLTLPGWYCAKPCGIFNSEAKEVQKACRVCGLDPNIPTYVITGPEWCLVERIDGLKGFDAWESDIESHMRKQDCSYQDAVRYFKHNVDGFPYDQFGG